jgi:hypothetical protein
MYGQQQLPAVAFGDGPPYSEDEDLHSPVVTTSRRRKNKSGLHGKDNGDGAGASYGETGDTDPRGEHGTHQAGQSYLGADAYSQGDPHYVPFDPGFEIDSDDEINEDETWQDDPSRYSRDYQFTIVSPDEEMHGKAVALFDFTREHENELPLKEGQVILVSYRHGQGWLVAEDPKTGESGLVPEEFVRLVRDIKGGLSSLNADIRASLLEVDDGVPAPGNLESDVAGINNAASLLPEVPASAPSINGNDNDGEQAAENETNNNHHHHHNNNSNPPNQGSQLSASGQDAELDKSKEKARAKSPAVLSTFSTSSRDLTPYPQHLLGGHHHSRSTPPQIEHYGEHLSRADSSASNRPKSIAKPSAVPKSGNSSLES